MGMVAGVCLEPTSSTVTALLKCKYVWAGYDYLADTWIFFPFQD